MHIRIFHDCANCTEDQQILRGLRGPITRSDVVHLSFVPLRDRATGPWLKSIVLTHQSIGREEVKCIYKQYTNWVPNVS